MTERSGAVTFKDNPMTLVGPEIKAGDQAPAFKLPVAGAQPPAAGCGKGHHGIVNCLLYHRCFPAV